MSILKTEEIHIYGINHVLQKKFPRYRDMTYFDVLKPTLSPNLIINKSLTWTWEMKGERDGRRDSGRC